MACFKYILYFALLIVSTRITLAKICRSVDIRNSVKSLLQLEDCTVVEGSVKILLMERATETEFESYSFPELREITDYLMFYRIYGLRSIGKLFPNLEIIRGNYLFKDYALVIVQMFSLLEIDLWSLREISRGSVIVFKNEKLCYADTVNWNQTTRRPSMENYQALNQQPKNCPRRFPDCPRGMIWSASYCQMISKNNCHSQCVGGCHSPGPSGCYACIHLSSSGECVTECPPQMYKFLDRRCVSQSECNSMYVKNPESEESSDKEYNSNYVIFKDTCVPSCPPEYEVSAGRECTKCNEGKCRKTCLGANVNSMQDAQNLKGCTDINGSIEISIKSENSETIRSELEENLGSIEVISGYLKVSRSSLTDLKFFKHLSIIYGNISNETDENSVLVVSENQNLQELWDWDNQQNLTIKQVKFFIHFNPKLCLKHIDRLKEVIKYKRNFTDLEVSNTSNGDKFPCQEMKIDVTISTRSYDFIEIHIPYIPNMFRSVLYYTKDPDRNVKMFDDIDQCSANAWRTKDISMDGKDLDVNGFYVNLTDLEPGTQYAFYLTTYTINSTGAISDLKYDSTLPTTPTELTGLYAFSNSSSTIILQWEPPSNVNGKLSEYIVTWVPLEEDASYIRQRDYCSYPMESNAESNERLDDVPKKKNDQKDCCKDKKVIEVDTKKEVDQFCSKFLKVQNSYILPETSTVSSQSCSSYFYSYIRKNQLFNIQHMSSENGISNNNNSFIHKYGELTPTNVSNTIKANNGSVYNNYKMNQTSITLPANASNFVVGGLMHFKNYVITVKGCRELHDHEKGSDDDFRCSKAEIVIVRTKGKEFADKIKNVRHYLNERKLSIFWDDPQNPNGIVVAFEIQYQRRGLLTHNQVTDCITYKKYEDSKKGYSISQIPLGRYEFRIRVISLYGKGPFTAFVSFDVVDSTFSVLGVVLTILINLLVICAIIVFVVYTFHAKKIQCEIVSDVNPNYHYIPDHYEFPRKDVEYVRELGVGRFGRVFHGILKSSNIECAIKTISEEASEDCRSEFFSEANTMKLMSEAYHIVKLLGVVSIGNPPLLLMELMELGDLKTYLRSLRETQALGSGTMIQMASEIADAMTFMEAKKFVHRDLAARNCMVSSTLSIKIGDFGMARDVYEKDYYRKNNRGLLPIRWMAPESLLDGEFTNQSDIWSYGVVLWEVTTMAEQPYQGSSNDEVLQQVIAGRKLEIPKHCPSALKTIMNSCWCRAPKERGSFMLIMSSLEYYHDNEFKRVAYYYSSEASANRNGTWEYVEMTPLLEETEL